MLIQLYADMEKPVSSAYYHRVHLVQDCEVIILFRGRFQSLTGESDAFYRENASIRVVRVDEIHYCSESERGKSGAEALEVSPMCISDGRRGRSSKQRDSTIINREAIRSVKLHLALLPLYSPQICAYPTDACAGCHPKNDCFMDVAFRLSRLLLKKMFVLQ